MVLLCLCVCLCLQVYLRLDQPQAALEWYQKATEAHPGDTQVLLGIARTYDALADGPRASHFYRRVLSQDAANIEAISCMAANHFYADQPEVALRYYRRLVQMGVRDTELWNNLPVAVPRNT